MEGKTRERINGRTGSRKSSVNSNVNDFKAGKIWWQFRLTIITTTRPHMSRCIRVTRNTLLHSLQRVIYRVQKHAYTACWESLQPFRESSPVSLRSLLRASKESSRVFFLRLNRNLIRIYKRLKKKKREIKYFLGLYIYIYSIYRFQIQFEQRPNTNCPNEAACRVPVSFGNLIMPTFNYDTRAHIMTALTY